jgi:hypothetical protein
MATSPFESKKTGCGQGPGRFCIPPDRGGSPDRDMGKKAWPGLKRPKFFNNLLI